MKTHELGELTSQNAQEVWFKSAASQKCPCLDSELTPPVRIKPPLLSLALSACHSCGLNLISPHLLSLASLYRTSFCHLLLFLYQPVPPMLSSRKALTK